MRDLFFQEAEAIVARLARPASSRHEARRLTHTLKANAAAMGFDALASLVHAIESDLNEGNRAWRGRCGELVDELARCRRGPGRGSAERERSETVEPVHPAAAPTPPANARLLAWVRVALSGECRMPAARATLLEKRARQLADPVVVVPEPDDWAKPEFDRVLVFWVPPGSAADVALSLREEPEVTAVTTPPNASCDRLPTSLITGQIRDLVDRLGPQTGKRLTLAARNEAPELPRPVFLAVRDALVHLARNAADHGIETPRERAAIGKPPRGLIQLDLWTDEDGWCATLKDDGRGLDREALRRRAADLGLTALRDELPFLEGLSTRAEITELSGRGIGLASVRERIASVGGAVEIWSEPGRGTVVALRVPWPAMPRAA